MKLCTKCGVEKDDGQFSGYHLQCRDCLNQQYHEKYLPVHRRKKTCSKCGVPKRKEMFVSYRDRKGKKRRTAQCKKCHREYMAWLRQQTKHREQRWLQIA